jgi:hypothetical protein
LQLTFNENSNQLLIKPNQKTHNLVSKTNSTEWM